MAAHSIEAALNAPRKAVAASLRRSESDCKRLAAEATEWKEMLGKAVERAIVLAQMTKQEVSYEMGYPDQSAVSRWIAGTEPTQWHKLMAVAKLRRWIPIALAELAKEEVEVNVTVTVRGRRLA